jgi:uroporphyrinogen decarboxylase
MNSKQRFYASIHYEKPDRPPIAPLHAQVDVWKKLYEYFKVTTHEDFQLIVGEDFRSIEPRYIGPELRTFEDGSWEGIWGERYKWVSFGSSANAEAVYHPYATITSIDEAKKLRYPSPDWYDYSVVKEQCQKYDDYALYAGSMGHGDFLNGVAFCRGVQQVLLDVAVEDPVYLYFVERRYEFFYEQIKRILEAGEGKIDVVRFGDDLGTQTGPIINPKTFEKLFAPKYEKFFSLVHQYGAKTMMHSCGSIKAFIPLFIDIGLDILDVVQVDAANMDIEELHRDFYGKIVFSGSISVQNLLRNGSVETIQEEIVRRKKLFADGGIFIGPTNIMQVDMPIENFVAMCTAIGCMGEDCHSYT